MITQININLEKYSGYAIDGSDSKNQLCNLNKINIFIGQNNSGKSRFIRTLFIDTEFSFVLSRPDLKKIKSFIDKKKLEIRQMLDNISIYDADKLYQSIDDLSKKVESFNFKNLDEIKHALHNQQKVYSNIKEFGSYSHKNGIISSRSPEILIPKINQIGFELAEFLREEFPEDIRVDFKKIYVPIMRGLRPVQVSGTNTFNNNESDNYKLRTIHDYFKKDEKTAESNIFTGLNFYDDVKEKLLGKREGRKQIKKFEEFLSQAFFHGKTVTLIPEINKDVPLIGLGDDERPVYQYGDGIQSLIILLYPLFFNQDKDLLVFLEEPEISLHPGMQRIFLETLMRPEFSRFQYFITTHSNHFLDLTLDFNNISIYTLIKSDEGSIKIENVSNEQNSTLDLLGVRNSSIFLSNCTIWVEGITDRLYLRRYLEVYQDYLKQNHKIKEPFREDLHYSFIEFAGSNITHYSFEGLEAEKIKASRLTNRILLIADTDNAIEKPETAKGKRLKAFKKALGENFIQVKGKEIENILADKILARTIASMEQVDVSKLVYSPKDLLFSNYQYKAMGDFISTVFKNLKRKYNDGNTIKNKLEFCQTAIKNIENFEDLSKPAKELVQKIFAFIKSNN